LRASVAAFAVLGPVERKSVPNKPVSDIGPTNGTDRHRSPISIAIYLDAIDEPTINEVEQRIGRLLSAAITLAFIVAAKLV